MCGIFGIITKPILDLNPNVIESAILNAFKLSETRGKDASGAIFLQPDQVSVIKSAQRVSHLIKQQAFKQLLLDSKNSYKAGAPLALFGHTRMVTNGTVQQEFNNQPVIKKDHLFLHNGIIVNDDDLWRSNPALQREYQVDTEIFGALMCLEAERGQPLATAMQSAFAKIKGANTIAALKLSQDQIVVGTSNGSMYIWISSDKNTVVFASERLIVEQTAKRLQHKENAPVVNQLKPGQAFSVDLTNLTVENFSLKGEQSEYPLISSTRNRKLFQIPANQTLSANIRTFSNNIVNMERLMSYDEKSIRLIKRCTKCLLPATFPFISFDINGVCQICRNYQPLKRHGESALRELADKARKNNGTPDCLVPISGGRDSCYGLHYIKKELGLNPVAYTYDWGLVTDLARRNISRMCGSLGVEHVLVAADIRQKRENVRKNVIAWMKSPALGMIPLFMAGDKMFFYYASLIRKQMRLGPILFSMNWLEKTGFKTGFANVNDIEDIDPSVKGKTHDIAIMNKLKLLKYYGNEFITNPAYLNMSLPDTLFAFFSFYLQSKDYDSIFDYLPWDEKTIEDTIIHGYDWETSPDTLSTWRIGDGTAPFYNYIYTTVAGFSEFDTFRSNQIREGLISRDQALALVYEENQPRVESFKWYCDTIGIDAIAALNVINNIPKLYPV